MEALRRMIEDYLYGLDNSLDLTMAAAEALARGIDSPALANLAGQSKDAVYEIRELLPIIIEELSIKVAPLAEAVFRKTREVARKYLAGELDFLTAARCVTGLLYDPNYLDAEERPDVGLAPLDDLWLLNEWVHAIDQGASEDDCGCYFKTRADAESHFGSVATALESTRN